MLKLDHIDAEVQPDVRTDEYVPLTVEIPDKDRAPTVYWRAIPSPQTLVEIGIAGTSGRLRSVTITNIDSSLVSAAPGELSVSATNARRGVPCFAMTDWPLGGDFGARFRDEQVATRLVVAPAACSVDFGVGITSATSIQAGQLRCVFGEDETLIRIDVLNLQEPDEQILQTLCG